MAIDVTPLRASRDFRFLYGGTAIGQLGSAFTTVAVPFQLYDLTGSTEKAVVNGIARTGRLVTSAALILFLAFVALAAGPGTEIKVLATGLAAGIILDATVVRALIVPALVTLFGRWNWWMGPRWARVLRVPRSDP